MKIFLLSRAWPRHLGVFTGRTAIGGWPGAVSAGRLTALDDLCIINTELHFCIIGRGCCADAVLLRAAAADIQPGTIIRSGRENLTLKLCGA